MMDRAYKWITSPSGFWTVLALYTIANAVLRLWASPNIGTDEVQQALAAQSWAWGYEPRNPPLHAWLLMSAYAVFGVSVLAHVVLKFTLYFALFGFAYLCGRRLLRTPGLAELSALSLVMLHMIGWTVLTGFTHTLALAVALFATLWSFLRLLDQQRLVDFAIFGLMIGLGFMSKNNFALFLVPLLVASMMVADVRAKVLKRGLLVSGLVAALVLAPFVVWSLWMQFDYAAVMADVTQSEVAGPYLTRVLAGLSGVVLSLLSGAAPFWIAAPLLFWPLVREKPAATASVSRVLWLTLAIGAVAPLLFVVIAGLSEIEGRYFAPILLQIPLAFFAWLDGRTARQRELKLFALWIAAMAALSFGVLLAQGQFYSRFCKRCWLEMPVAALAEELRAEGFDAGTIIADEWHLGGNLRLEFPDAAILVPGFRITSLSRLQGSCVLVWNARLSGEPPPPAMMQMAAARLGSPPQWTPTYVDALMLRNGTRLDRFGYVVVPNADGDCRPK